MQTMMTIEEYEELLRLKKLMEHMIDGHIPIDREQVERYNALCRKRMGTSQGG